MSGRKHFPLAALRVGELTRIAVSRWGLTLPDDDAGRDDLMLILYHHACLQNPRRRMLNFTELYAPWLAEREREELFDEILRHPPPMYSADELGNRLGLRDADRSTLGVKTIGAIDCNKEQRAARRKLKKRERERERRAMQIKARPVPFRSRANTDAATLRFFLPDCRKRTISEIAERAMKIRDPISLKPNGRPLDREALRRKFNRLADRLDGLLEQDFVMGPNRCRVRRIWWARSLGTED
jgi:hypothetical protein